MLEFVQKDTLLCSYMRKTPRNLKSCEKHKLLNSIINIKNWDVMCDIKKAGNFRQSEARDTFISQQWKRSDTVKNSFWGGSTIQAVAVSVCDRTILICFQKKIHLLRPKTFVLYDNISHLYTLRRHKNGKLPDIHSLKYSLPHEHMVVYFANKSMYLHFKMR